LARPQIDAVGGPDKPAVQSPGSWWRRRDFNMAKRSLALVSAVTAALDEPGLIEKGEKGVLTVPYDEIVIHAGLTEAA